MRISTRLDFRVRVNGVTGSGGVDGRGTISSTGGVGGLNTNGERGGDGGGSTQGISSISGLGITKISLWELYLV